MPQQLNLLTCLRFFAAAWVVAFDFAPSLGFGVPSLVAKGYLGVDLFFALSGFILCHVYLPAWGEKRFSYRGFLWARLARIYPVHLALLGALVGVSGLAMALNVDVDRVAVWSSLPAQLTLTQAWGLGSEGGWNHPAWSISAEWFAYLVFPVFAAALWRFRNHTGLVVMSALIALVAVNEAFTAIAGAPLTRMTLAWGALRILPSFMIGCAAWLAWRNYRVAGAPVCFLMTCAAIAVATLTAGLDGPDWLSIAAFGALIFALASLDTAGSYRPVSRTLIYLGEVSFSLYMIVMPVQTFAQQLFEKLRPELEGGAATAFWVIAVASLLPVAMLMHRFVETPARSLLRRVGLASFSKRRELAALPTPS